jgi:hypothetical protein
MNRFLLPFLILLGLSMLSLDTPKLSKRKIYDGVSVLMPEDWVVMSDNDIATRYPSTKKPLSVYMSADTKADFNMNNTKAKFAGQDAKMLHEIYKATIMETYDTSTVGEDDPFRSDRVKKSFKFLSDGVRTINKKEYAYFEYTSEFGSIKKYNYIMYAPHKKHVLIFNFTCDLRAMNVYQPVAQAMMNSVKVSPKLTMPDYVLQQNNLQPRKRQTPQDLLEMQNKNKAKQKK